MIQTTTLIRILQSELPWSPINERGTQITAFDKGLLSKILSFDSDVYDLVTEKIFLGETLSEPKHDKDFKKIFIARNLQKQIQTQTFDAFCLRCASCFMKHRKFLDQVYMHFDKFISGATIQGKTDKSSTTTRHRQSESELPQNETSISLDLNEMLYADKTLFYNTLSENDGGSETKGESYSPDALKQMYNLLEPILKDFDKQCFLRVW